MKVFTLTGPESSRRIEIGDDEMIVYDVMKIADYESEDYEPRDKIHKQDA
jgi:hypothetical protein